MESLGIRGGFGFKCLMPSLKRICLSVLAGFSVVCVLHADNQARWYRGNLHTHTLWSDGDDFPEMIIEWYKTNQYDFLTLSDHNTIASGTKWVGITNESRKVAFDKYLARWGTSWVEQRKEQDVLQVRLKT